MSIRHQAFLKAICDWSYLLPFQAESSHVNISFCGMRNENGLWYIIENENENEDEDEDENKNKK